MVDYLVRAMGLFELIDINGDGFCDDVEQTRAAVAGIVRLDAPYWGRADPASGRRRRTTTSRATCRWRRPPSAIGYGEVFMTEQTAMVWNATRIWPQLMELGGTDKFGVFNLPRLSPIS